MFVIVMTKAGTTGLLQLRLSSSLPQQPNEQILFYKMQYRQRIFLARKSFLLTFSRLTHSTSMAASTPLSSPLPEFEKENRCEWKSKSQFAIKIFFLPLLPNAPQPTGLLFSFHSTKIRIQANQAKNVLLLRDCRVGLLACCVLTYLLSLFMQFLLLLLLHDGGMSFMCRITPPLPIS